MKRIRLDQWASQLQPPRHPRVYLFTQQPCPHSGETKHTPRRPVPQRPYQTQHQWQAQRRHVASRRKASSAAAAAAAAEVGDVEEQDAPVRQPPPPLPVEGDEMNAPSHRQALRSAKLSALHARLALPPRLPLQTLARCLVDASVDPRPGYNNAPLALLGQDLLGYYTAEWLLCHYPRLPTSVLFAAQYAYVGSQTLAAMRAEWGVDPVAAPGPEVDAGLLQLTRATPGNAMVEGETMRIKDMPGVRKFKGNSRPHEPENYRRGMSSRIVYDDQFGDTFSNLQSGLSSAGDEQAPYAAAPISTSQTGDTDPPKDATPDASSQQPPTPQHPNDGSTTLESASASFIRALTGALHLHAGSTASKHFHKQFVLSRQLPLHTLFHFTHPARDLSILCGREGFEPPVARLISETGRLSRTPVFVVGVYSGDDKLGEGAGSSLDEGRVRAAAAALRSWYLYSPPESEVVLPSDVEGAAGKAGAKEGRKKWKPQLVDIGEVVS